ncbi:hypothetical protein BH10ACI3_BH10ACI3_08370 [soil metagenome]
MVNAENAEKDAEDADLETASGHFNNRVISVYHRDMKNALMLMAITVLATISISAQATTPADPKDVASLDAIMTSVYDVISGDKAKVRDWDRFRSLFYTGARLIPSGKNAKTGIIGATVMSPDDYVKRAEPFFAEEGFFEIEKARHVDMYGNIAQVFSTYESRHAANDAKPFARGINSFQLLNDGKRWWILTIYWQAETPDNKIPDKYLKNSK